MLPGMKGPKPVVHSGSVDDETAANVRPQKLPSAKIVLAWFMGTPLTLYAHFRANLLALSPASTPTSQYP